MSARMKRTVASCDSNRSNDAHRIAQLQGTSDVKAVPTVQIDSYNRPAGVNHNVINVNPYEFRFLEIELK
jgi:hypothetical protein